MADSGTLATTAQVLLSIGQNANAAQILEANTNYWILYAESEMEMEAGQGVGLVANYASITAAYKQWLAVVAANRAALFIVIQGLFAISSSSVASLASVSCFSSKFFWFSSFTSEVKSG